MPDVMCEACPVVHPNDDRQVAKQALAFRVLDQEQTDRHFTSHQLAELFTLSAQPLSEAEPPSELPADADSMLKGLVESLAPEYIVTHHDHESLLEDNEAELSEEEVRL